MSEPLSLDPSASLAQIASPGDDTSEHQKDSSKREGSNIPSEATWATAVELIRRSTTVLLICHVSPDGDAIGSLLGLGLSLQSLGKTPTLACESPLSDKFGFLPGFTSIVRKVESNQFDLVIALDSSDVSRLGNVYDSDQFAGIPLINIDHHITNLDFGDVDLVDPTAASTAEMVLTLLDHLGLTLVPHNATDSALGTLAFGLGVAQRIQEIATCLLTGIVTDTLGFRTSNVSPRVMRAAMRLMEAGASLSEITHFSFNQRPLADLKLLARGLSRMQAKDGLAWSEITLHDRHTCGITDEADVGLVSTLVRTKEVHIAAVFTEKENSQVEIGFRADPGFDVAQLALTLGGGGHPAASGCTLDGSLETVKARVLRMLRTALEEQLRCNNTQH